MFLYRGCVHLWSLKSICYNEVSVIKCLLEVFFESLTRISSFPTKVISYKEVSAMQDAWHREIWSYFEEVITLAFPLVSGACVHELNQRNNYLNMKLKFETFTGKVIQKPL